MKHNEEMEHSAVQDDSLKILIEVFQEGCDFKVDENTLLNDSNFGFDSYDLMDKIMVVENRLKVKIPIEIILDSTSTIMDIKNYIDAEKKNVV